jgi:hypothetical protein
MWRVAIVLLVGCSSSHGSAADAPPDNRAPDSRPPPPPPPPTACQSYAFLASCLDGVAKLTVKQMAMDGGPSGCSDQVAMHACEMGCTAEGNLPVNRGFTGEVLAYLGHPEVLCKGACPGNGCPAPSTATWSPTPCDGQTISTYGGPSALGKIGPTSTAITTCLVAWDTTANVQRSAVARACLGGWECPVGTICDDAIETLPATFTTKFAVCKPGPRGVLTASMLAP